MYTIIDLYCNVHVHVCLQHLCVRGSTEIVKRWVNETQEAVSSDNVMVQYHAMGLLYHIRKKDRLAVSKMVTKQIRSSLRSPHGYCLLIRIACKILENEERTSNSMLYDFLETCLRHKSEVGRENLCITTVQCKKKIANISCRQQLQYCIHIYILEKSLN